MEKVNFWKTAFKKFEGAWSALSKPHPLKFFKGCLPQSLLGPFLNTLSHLMVCTVYDSDIKCDLLGFIGKR